MHKLIILFGSFLCFSGYVLSDDTNCFYVECTYPWRRGLGHAPCLERRDVTLIRSVTCKLGDDDGSEKLYHVCCKEKRPVVQAFRQFAFVLATMGLDFKSSHNCQLRVLCELSCIDSITKPMRPDYPFEWPGYGDEMRELVAAYYEGEKYGCFGTRTNYNKTSCENSCKQKYSSCEKEEKSFGQLGSCARKGHWFGMNFFDFAVKSVTVCANIEKVTEIVHGFRTRENSTNATNTATNEDLEAAWIQYLENMKPAQPNMTPWLRNVTYGELQDFVEH